MKKPRGDRSRRLLNLVMLLLRARAPVTYRDIREQFSAYQTANDEAGLRAFERDKADLLDLGVPIRYLTPEEDDALEDGGYIIDLKRFRLPEVHLTSDEVSALVLAGSIARALPSGSYPEIVDLALRKLAFDTHEVPDTPLEFPLPAQREQVLVHIPATATPSAGELEGRFASLEAATQQRKRVTLRYRTASTGIIESRAVDPYALVYRQGAWLLVGHCHLRKDIRTFRLDRMVDVEVAPRPKSPDFERPENLDARAYANRSPWTFCPEPAEEVELLLGVEAAAVANEELGADAVREPSDDGSVRVRFLCGNPEYVVSRILAAKGAITVSRGDRLKARLAAELAQIAELYA